ncbi:hypothetical protein [Paenibacillus hubeiensis]|uniref:hypothetical protein n=1 Tax=Paenibacillus hubeiensis TaxID=3077330 RepID=UPI0031BB096B
MFQVGRNGIDGTFLSQGPPPKLTLIESKSSQWGNFPYSNAQLEGGKKYFQGMLENGDSRYDGFEEKLEQLKKENPGLQFDYIRVETDIMITDVGFGVDVLKVKEWK